MDALIIMCIGMTVVFVFLTALVGIMATITRLLPSVAASPTGTAAATVADHSALIAVMQAAVTAYEDDTTSPHQ